jgi:DMSO/TMAO reductase YedYZ molybdopterin-dependent catalytic subunit
MPLFILHHQHDSERCPAKDPYRGSALLNHLSPASVHQHGVQIHAEAVVEGEHSLYLIVDAADERRVRDFIKPFEACGTVNVYPASSCAKVVASGGCGAEPPRVDLLGPAADPEKACEEAIRTGLVVHRCHPLNGEASIPALIGGAVMPNAKFYIRNHFQIPLLDSSRWRLAVHGLVERRLDLSLRDLQNLPSQSLVVTLECAGNGRWQLDPPVEGEQWRLGAVSTAEWTGVPLIDVLDRAGVKTTAREVILRGADGGTLDGRPDLVHFERSLSLDQIRESQALLAYAMNGEPLPIQHGYPLRVVVPGWYGVTSVKWLTEIEVIDRVFNGYFQSERYFYEWQRDGQVLREPVTLQRVRALIVEPRSEQVLEAGDFTIRGVAWSGAAPIARVEVSVGGGPWQESRLVGERKRYSWQWWELSARAQSKGTVSLRARATDLAGRTQPERPEWNRLGYGNNGIQEIAVHFT